MTITRWEGGSDNRIPAGLPEVHFVELGQVRQVRKPIKISDANEGFHRCRLPSELKALQLPFDFPKRKTSLSPFSSS